MPPSSVLIDNTTLAGAGRVLAFGDYPQSPGAAHAREYYETHVDAEGYDYASFLEFLTAFVLFDELVWDGSSAVQEEHGEGTYGDEPNDFGTNDVWVYDWFPPFEILRGASILSAFADSVTYSPKRLQRARYVALAWVKDNLAAGRVELPRGFRVPITYEVSDYHDRHEFVKLNQNFKLSNSHLGIAAFLHRGLFYQSRATSMEAVCYLPHSFRSSLLWHPTLQALAPFCDNWHFPVATEPSAFEVLRSFGEKLAMAVQGAVSLSGLSPTQTVGGAFHQWAPDSADRAFKHAYEFRQSPAGEDLRAWFRELLSSGETYSQLHLANRLQGMEKDLKQFLLARFGAAVDGDKHVLQLLDLTAGARKYVEPLLGMLPLQWQEAITKLLYRRLTRHRGYQVLFSYYLPGQQLPLWP